MAAAEEGTTAMLVALKPVDAVLAPAEAKALAADEKDTKTPGKKAAEVVVAAADAGVKCAGDGEEKLPVLVPLPWGHINAILSLKREPPPTPQELERLSPEEREELLQWDELYDEFEEFQDEVRREVEETGGYMIDESYFTRQAEIQAEMEKEWAMVDFSGIIIGDWDYDNPTCCEPL